jgi:hypothetical protein
MKKKTKSTSISANNSMTYQYSFDDLKPGETIHVPIDENGIGGELLNILSKGLYTNPLDAIREYVQNSIDANADEVTIQITGKSVFILDRGDGMSRDQLLESRKFGVSAKSLFLNVGFRGIGIYSGFDLCERLVIRTKTHLEDTQHILEFEFGEMRRKLEKARLDPNRPALSLSDLLSQHIIYRYESTPNDEKSFTIVQLEELSNSHIHKLSNIEEMKNYILKNLPVRFGKKFPYANMIETTLKQNVPGYKSAKIILKIEHNPQVSVEKPNIADLEQPLTGFVTDSNNKPYAFYWACITSVTGSIASRELNSDFAGLIYKLKGFTIGDRQSPSIHFTRKQIYTWLTGEIYVINPELIPTSARDNFEAGPVKDAFEAALREVLSGRKDSLQKKALDAQASRRADSVIDSSQEKIDEIDEIISSGTMYDDYALFTQLHDIIEDIKQQKGKATDKHKANQLQKHAESLQRKTKREIDQPTTQVQKKSASQSPEPSTELSTQKATKPKQNDDGGKSLPRILEIIRKGGWEINPDLLPILTLIDETILDHLGMNSNAYKSFVEDFQARLDEMFGEEG